MPGATDQIDGAGVYLYWRPKMPATILFPKNGADLNVADTGHAEGTAQPKSRVYYQVDHKKNGKKVESQTVNADSQGIWYVAFGKSLPTGSYTARANQLPDRDSRTNPDDLPPDAQIDFIVTA